MQGYCDVYKWTILKRTSPEAKCLHLTSSKRDICMSSVSNVIYHKFSHGAAFYTLNGKNVKVVLEWLISIEKGGKNENGSVASPEGCSKLTTSLVNVSLNFEKLISQICQFFC